MFIQKNHGFTLIELLIICCILGIALALATPSLVTMINKNKKEGVRDELVSALSLARSAAITAGSWATICSSNQNQTQCKQSSDDWRLGWLVFRDKNRDGRVDSGEKIISVKGTMTDDISIRATNNRITYDSQGIADGYKTTLCTRQFRNPLLKNHSH